jgi:hydrogenase maturation factor HypE
VPEEDIDDFDQALKLDVLAASLRADTLQSADLLEQLARMLQAAVPESVEISRGGWFLSKDRPIEELTVKFDEYQYQIVKQKHGSVTARSMKVVRGVVLKTTEIPVEKCIEEILAELERMAAKNAQTRRALNKFVLG